MDKTPIGDRMKEYERWVGASNGRHLHTLPLVVRIDGKGFSRWTSSLAKPWYEPLQQCFQKTAYEVMRDVLRESVIAFGQSDEVSFGFRSYPGCDVREHPFGGKHDKIVSIAASAFTAAFNVNRMADEKLAQLPVAVFDARAFSVPNTTEAVNAFLWRQQDATRNSIQAAARTVASHSECMNLNTNQLQELLYSKAGINWNNYPTEYRCGWSIIRQVRLLNPNELTDIPAKYLPAKPIERNVLDLNLETPIFSTKEGWHYVQDRFTD